MGAVAADDPQAAMVGRDALIGGGSAADAAVAMYFTMAVTLPSEASLGGGGVCIAFDPNTKRLETLDFLPRAPAGAQAGDRPVATPGNVRGFFALHARYGRLRWEYLLQPAETLARFGAPVSRALAQQWRPIEPSLLRDSAFAQVFGAPGAGGRLASEGETVVQLDLAATLGRLRGEGPGDFYVGQLATQFTAAVTAAGGTLSKAELARTQAQWRPTIDLPFGRRVAHFPSPPPEGAALAAFTWAALAEDDRYEDASAVERSALLAERSRAAAAAVGETPDATSWKAWADRARSLAQADGGGRRPSSFGEARPANPWAAGLVAVDKDGGAVVCQVTMNALFGTGRIAPSTGIVLAAAPDTRGRDFSMLSTMLATSGGEREFVYAGVASGGWAAPAALISVAAETLLAEAAVSDGLAAPRVAAFEHPTRAQVETTAPAAAVSAIEQRGFSVSRVPSLGDALAISCPGGLPNSPDRCRADADPRGRGLGLSTE